MKDIRAIRKIVTGVHAVDGAGVNLVRVIGHGDTSRRRNRSGGERKAVDVYFGQTDRHYVN